ncbi:MAG: YwiC-like family protein [Nitrospinae bacterium]|nr:YwiC-like family protein [Nitrospinota bacterium]
MKKYLPNEHGVWLMLFFPLISGIAAVASEKHNFLDGYAPSSVAAGAFFVFVLASFILTKPISAIHSRKESFKDYLVGVVLLVVILLLCAAVLEHYSRLFTTLLILSPLFFVFTLSSLFIKISKSSLIKLSGGALFPLSAIGGYYAFYGIITVDAFILYLLNMFFFFPRSLLATEYFIEKKRGFWGKASVSTIFSLVFVISLHLTDFVNVKIVLFFLVFSLPIFLTLLGRYDWDNIRSFGKTEMCTSILFTTLLISFY